MSLGVGLKGMTAHPTSCFLSLLPIYLQKVSSQFAAPASGMESCLEDVS